MDVLVDYLVDLSDLVWDNQVATVAPRTVYSPASDLYIRP